MSNSEVVKIIGFELGGIKSAAEKFSANSGSDDFVYARLGSPTVSSWEKTVAGFEKAEHCLSFASGMAAIAAALAVSLRKSDDRGLLVPSDIYAGTQHLLKDVFVEYYARNVEFVEIDNSVDRTDQFLEAISVHRPGVVYFEPISNPFVSVLDTPAIIERAKSIGALVLIDNTFASPYLCTPLSSGADMVIQSATKYLCGHNDTLAGTISTNDDGLFEALHKYRTMTGSVLSPDCASRLLSYARTFDLRVAAQNKNAAVLARFLKDRASISAVHYPGLDNSPHKSLADRSFGDKGYGAIVSFQLTSGVAGCEILFAKTAGKVPHIGTLGDVEHSLLHIESSFGMGYPTDAIRVSVGAGSLRSFLETLGPILDDLEQG